MAAFYKFIFNRSGRLKQDGTAPIHLRITLNRKIKYINTEVYVNPSEWETGREGGMVVGNRFAMQYNQIINDLKNNIKQFELDCKHDGRMFTFDSVDQAMSINYNSFIEWVIDEITRDTRLVWNTKKTHLSFLNIIKQSGIIKSFADITHDNIEQLERYLRSERNMAPTTIAKRHTMLRGYINRAIKKRLIKPDKDPYIYYKREKVNDPKRRFLSGLELRRLQEKDLHIDRLRKVRDFFLFSCYTGLAYADILKLQQRDVYADHNTTFIITDRQKTDEESAIPLLPQAAEIIERYRSADRVPLFPIPSNQKINAFLKEIQLLCDISTKLTFHVARHTFATTVTLENGVPIETVSRMLGHSSLQTTQIYAKITRKKLADDMAALSKKMGK